MLMSIEAQDAKQAREKLTPEIGLKCFLTPHSGSIISKTTLKDSTPLILVFIHVACAGLLLGMRRHVQQHEVARLIQMLEDGSTQQDIAAAFGVTQSVVSRAWNRHLATAWWLHQTKAKDAYDARPLAKTAKFGNDCASPSQYCPSTPDGIPASLRTANH